MQELVKGSLHREDRTPPSAMYTTDDCMTSHSGGRMRDTCSPASCTSSSSGSSMRSPHPSPSTTVSPDAKETDCSSTTPLSGDDVTSVSSKRSGHLNGGHHQNGSHHQSGGGHHQSGGGHHQSGGVHHQNGGGHHPDDHSVLMVSPTSHFTPLPSVLTSPHPGHGKPEALCLVCGDRASGKHYGVQSCDGCRGFFKRSIRRSLKYVCKEKGRCVVDVARRNQCQACRFSKCLTVNMNKDAVQHERAPRCYQYKHDSPEPITTSNGDKPHHEISAFHSSALLARGISAYGQLNHFPAPVGGIPPEVTFPHHPHNPHLFSHHLPISMATAADQKPAFSPHLHLSKDSSSPLDSLKREHQARTGSEDVKHEKQFSNLTSNTSHSGSGDHQPGSGRPLVSQSSHPHGAGTLPAPQPVHPTIHIPTPVLDPNMYANAAAAENTYETAARLLFMSVKWARNIPSFLQLPFRDQAILLEESWNELFILSAAQWALSVDVGTLLAANGLPTDTSQNEKASTLAAHIRTLQDVISRFNQYKVDATEYACLKALVLFKSEIRGLRDSSQVEMLQDQAQLMLSEYSLQQYPTSKTRFGKVLLLLPGLRSIGSRTLEHIFFKRTIGSVPIERLLCDMFKSS